MVSKPGPMDAAASLTLVDGIHGFADQAIERLANANPRSSSSDPADDEIMRLVADARSVADRITVLTLKWLYSNRATEKF